MPPKALFENIFWVLVFGSPDPAVKGPCSLVSRQYDDITQDRFNAEF